jgi:3-hydroxyacyl-CoA dehydrogenase
MADIDVILDVLKQSQAAYPTSTFVNSLMRQYMERGSLSKKQLEGLYHKASGVETISPGKLATIQAIILKKHSKHRSTVSVPIKAEPVDTITEKLIDEILLKYPQHKRVLFFKLKCEKKDVLSASEKTELEKFHKLLL